MLFFVKVAAKFAGVYPLALIYLPKRATYVTLLMSTGLTFGTIASLYGLQAGYIDKAQFSILVTVVIATAIIPTVIAQRFFQPPIPPTLEQVRVRRTSEVGGQPCSGRSWWLMMGQSTRGEPLPRRSSWPHAAGAELHMICVEEHLPHYAATVGEVLEEKGEEDSYFEALVKEATKEATAAGVRLHPLVTPGHEVETTIRYAGRQGFRSARHRVHGTLPGPREDHGRIGCESHSPFTMLGAGRQVRPCTFLIGLCFGPSVAPPSSSLEIAQ